MYEFHYRHIKRKHNATLLFRDTDSLVYQIGTNDIHEDLYENKNLFCHSDYPQNSRFFDLVN